MSQKNDRVYIQHIVESIVLIEDFVRDGRETFMHSPLISEATIRKLQTVMESSQHISETTKTANPHIPWRTMAGFRNVMTHDYLALDLQIVWNVVEHELPALKFMFHALLEHEGGEK